MYLLLDLRARFGHFVVVIDQVTGVGHILARNQKERHVREVGHEQSLRFCVHPLARIDRCLHVLRVTIPKATQNEGRKSKAQVGEKCTATRKMS